MLFDDALSWLADYDATPDDDKPRLTAPRKLSAEQKRAALEQAKRAGL